MSLLFSGRLTPLRPPAQTKAPHLCSHNGFSRACGLAKPGGVPLWSPGTSFVGRSVRSGFARNALQDQVQLVQQAESADRDKPVLVYLPGTDGTGNALRPQLASLLAAGFDVRTLYIPITNRSSWEELEAETVSMLRELAGPGGRKVMVVAESFGGCLGLRVARAAPTLIERMVLVNPATSFARSYARLPSLVAATGLLSIFPEQLYQVAQAVLVPFLVDKEKVGPAGLAAIRAMMMMQPPDACQVDDAGLSEQLPYSRQDLGTLTSFLPSATASWRLRLLNTGGMSDSDLRNIRVPTLVVASAGDKLLPSLSESARLQRIMPQCQRVVLPDSGHTALLEASVSLIAILHRASFLPEGLTPDQTLANSVNTSSAAQHPDVASGEASPDSPLLSGIMRIDGEAIETQQANMANGSSKASKQLPGSNGKPPRRGIAMRDLQDAGSANQVQDPDRLSSEALQAGYSNGSGQVSASVRGRSEAADEVASAQVTAAAAEARIEASGGNGSSVAAAVQQQVLSEEMRPDSIAQAREAAAKGPAAAEDEAKRKADLKAKQVLTVREARALRGDALQAKWAAADKEFEEATQWLSLLRNLVSPVMQGTENLPSREEVRPLLFVGNHSRMGVYDLPWVLSELYLRGYKARGLAHRGHWSGPLGQFFERFGAVKASPLAAYRLLSQGEAVLLYPGGGREVNKRQGAEYQLQWREAPDFVRLAAKTNAIIIPFACVGGDDAYDLFMDTETILSNPVLGPLARSALGRIDPDLDVMEAVLPITRLPGLGIPSIFPIPRLERLYFRFMPPVDAAAELADVNNADAAAAAYGKVRDAVNDGMSSLLKFRESDPMRDLSSRVNSTLTANAPAFDLLSGVLPGSNRQQK